MRLFIYDTRKDYSTLPFQVQNLILVNFIKCCWLFLDRNQNRKIYKIPYYLRTFPTVHVKNTNSSIITSNHSFWIKVTESAEQKKTFRYHMWYRTKGEASASSFYLRLGILCNGPLLGFCDFFYYCVTRTLSDEEWWIFCRVSLWVSQSLRPFNAQPTHPVFSDSHWWKGAKRIQGFLWRVSHKGRLQMLEDWDWDYLKVICALGVNPIVKVSYDTNSEPFFGWSKFGAVLLITWVAWMDSL